MATALNYFLKRHRTYCYRIQIGMVLAALIAPCIALSQEAEAEPEPGVNAAEQAEKNTNPVKNSLKRVTPDVSKNNDMLFSKEMPEGSIQWLEANNEKFISIWEPDRSGNPFGAILIVHGEGQTADWPYTIRAVRQSLPDHGWSTLSISLPPIAPIAIPPRSPANDPAGLAQNDASMQLDDNVFARLKAGIDHLNQKGQFNIVILAHGIGASRAVRYLSSLSQNKNNQTLKPNGLTNKRTRGVIDKPIRAFIMVNARNGEPGSPSNITKHLTDTTLPILDVYFGDHILDGTEPMSRKQAAKKHRLEAFHQIKLLVPSANWQQGENRLTRRARGFLNKYAKGVEIEG